MSNVGFPQTGISEASYFSQGLKECDSNKRRRLFADARQSNLCSHQVYVLGAEIEETFGADMTRLKAMVVKGVLIFKNPAGQGAPCTKVSRQLWLQNADAAQGRGHAQTARAVRQAVDENLPV